MNNAKEEGARLNAIGSGIQGLGVIYEAIGAVEGNSPTKSLELTGNSLFALGLFIDAAGSMFVAKKLDTSGERLSFIGSWIQVLGACAGYKLAGISITCPKCKVSGFYLSAN